MTRKVSTLAFLKGMCFTDFHFNVLLFVLFIVDALWPTCDLEDSERFKTILRIRKGPVGSNHNKPRKMLFDSDVVMYCSTVVFSV